MPWVSVTGTSVIKSLRHIGDRWGKRQYLTYSHWDGGKVVGIAIVVEYRVVHYRVVHGELDADGLIEFSLFKESSKSLQIQ